MFQLVRNILLSLCLLPAFLFSHTASACGSSEPLLGSMCVFAGNFAPRGYALAQGQLLPISQYSALFSILGTTYGGDGRTTFALPDTRGRAVIGQGQGPGLSDYRLGEKGGVETVTLTVAQMPSHSHTATTTIENDVEIDGVIDLNASSGKATTKQTAGNVLAKAKRKTYSASTPDVKLSPDSITFSLIGEVNSTATTTLSETGGNQGHENRMPYIAVNWIIALQGLFPSRN